jgi:ketosteroid isomerase-like protein
VPTLKTVALSLATAAAVTVTGGLLLTADQGEASRPDRQTEKRTLAWMQAVERTDLEAVAEFQHADIVLTQPMTFDGSQEPILVGAGRDQVLGYFRSVFARTPRIDFFDTRISVTHGGNVSFVETKGDFTAADGRAYRNVYVWRLDWTADGRLLRIADYYNPVILCDTWPENPSCDLFATAE